MTHKANSTICGNCLKTEPKPENFLVFEQILAQTIANMRKLVSEKGAEYAGDHDHLANFRRNALSIGCSMELVWRVYAGKHWDAVSQFVSDIHTGKTRTRTEPITGRVDDLIVYMVLLKAILAEREQDAKTKSI